ncbi:hypothetical protein HO173_006144 [Letharia columbiana]|uniref:Uncharacterized protein n=1 Tax=Letharia columbiana TaxID=112416 RepID=A0A8H6L4R2_9LECA|nr:uncharacterized protein HO173_006144 [Letharia columbiana]KAF6235461.1 hypothetical protein HO173_006144 [Letharia columbiana]
MKGKEELKVILEAQLPKSYQSTKASVEDEQQESSKTGAQPAPPGGSCASPEYAALFVAWPFRAPSRGQTPMPASVTSLIDKLPTTGERIAAKRLWNRSLPVAANVGIVEYNRVDGEKFREKVAERVGEGWWRKVEELARGLNEAAGIIRGEEKSGGVVEGKVLQEGSMKGVGSEMKTSELPKEEGKKPEMINPDGTGGKSQEYETNTPDHLAESAALVVRTEEGRETEDAKSTLSESQEPQPKPDDETTEAAMSLLTLSSTPASSATADASALAASNPLSALWYLISRFFSSGHSAASYFFVALEAAIRHDSATVHALHIPAPPAFWTDAADWRVPKVGMTLLLTLAASDKAMFDAFARFSKSLGRPAPSVESMRTGRNSASLRKAVLRAKADAADKRRTTVLGVDLRDVRYGALCERHGRGVAEHFATFARMFVLGVCPAGAKLWLVGGPGGETATVWESNVKVGAGVGTWEEMDEFVRAFEGFAVSNGQWNSKRFKWFHRCFAVDLKQFDLQIDEAEKKKRGREEMEVEGVKRLLNEIEAWVEIYRIEDVKMADVGKFTWL